MRIDWHVHVCADTTGHGKVSRPLRDSQKFRFLRRRLGLTHENGQAVEHDILDKLVETVNGTEELDATVVLAFDAVHDEDGRLGEANTHLFRLMRERNWLRRDVLTKLELGFDDAYWQRAAGILRLANLDTEKLS